MTGTLCITSYLVHPATAVLTVHHLHLFQMERRPCLEEIRAWVRDLAERFSLQYYILYHVSDLYTTAAVQKVLIVRGVSANKSRASESESVKRLRRGVD